MLGNLRYAGTGIGAGTWTDFVNSSVGGGGAFMKRRYGLARTRIES